MASKQVELVDYLEKSVVVFGNTKPYAKLLSENNGMYNKSLTYVENGEKTRKPGWVFYKHQKNLVQQLVDKINSGTLDSSSSSSSSSSSNTNTSISTENLIDKKTFLALLSRVERLEQELKLLQLNNGIGISNNNVSSNVSKNVSNNVNKNSKNIVQQDYDEYNNESDDEDDNENIRPVRFLRK